MGSHKVGEELDSQMRQVLEAYLAQAVLLQWRDLAGSVKSLDIRPEVAQSLAALSGIESDSQIIRRKISLVGVDQHFAIREFLITWMAEEAEHARMLRVLTKLSGYSVQIPTRRAYGPVDILGLPLLRLIAPNVALATYAVLGCAQEYIALTVYSEVGRQSGHEIVRSLLLNVARQESRHMRFYKGIANIACTDVKAIRGARSLLSRMWKPPGLDLMSDVAHQGAFGYLMRREEFIEQLAGLDHVIDGITGMGQLGLMRGWLTSNKPKYTSI